MSFAIPTDTLLALVAVAWSDGAVGSGEAAGVRAAATQLGLAAEEITQVDAALARPFGLDEVETVRMSRVVRLFTYAAAIWVTEIDGKVTDKELATLAVLGDRLGLSDAARQKAASAARAAHGSGQPGAYDLSALRSRISAGLSQVGDE